MKYCEKCKVYVPSDREHCPLCQSILTEEDASRSYPGYDDEIFPYLPTIYHRHNLLIRLSLFLSIAVCVICLTLNLLIWPQRWWSLFVLAGVGAGWATGGASHPPSAAPSANMFCTRWSPWASWWSCST